MFRLVTFVATAFVCLGLLANPGLSGGGKKEGKMKGMLPPGWKKLNLSDDQVQGIYAVQHAYKAKREAIEEQLNDLRQQERKEMFKLLTEDQRDLLRRLSTGEDSKDAPKTKEAPPKQKEEPAKKDK